MMKRYSHHTFSVQSPHTMDAILFRDVKIRNCGYRPLQQEAMRLLQRYCSETFTTIKEYGNICTW